MVKFSRKNVAFFSLEISTTRPSKGKCFFSDNTFPKIIKLFSIVCIFFCSQNICVWLQWCNFVGKIEVFSLEVSHLQALIRNSSRLLYFYTKSYQICVFASIMFEKFCCFPCKNELLANLLRVLWEILLISSQYVYFMSNVCYICASSCYCIKCHFMPFVYLVSKYIYLLAFSL